MIEIKALSKSFADKQALNELSLSIPHAAIFGLLGPNGAGKTTLISILNGLITADSGEVFIAGLSLRNNLHLVRERCSLIPQSLAFYEQLTVKENLLFFAGIQNIKGKVLQQNLAYAVETNRLASMLNQPAATLSGGQKRRLNIAIGLLNNPDILFFDEPTVGIDPESRNQILDSIKAYKADNKTVVYTSHYMPEVEKICDQLAIINAGEIVKQGSLSSMLNNQQSEQVIIELYAHVSSSLPSIVRQLDSVKLIDDSTLLLSEGKGALIAHVLALLEQQKIKVKQLRFGASSLESLFISLTSKEEADV